MVIDHWSTSTITHLGCHPMSHHHDTMQTPWCWQLYVCNYYCHLRSVTIIVTYEPFHNVAGTDQRSVVNIRHRPQHNCYSRHLRSPLRSPPALHAGVPPRPGHMVTTYTGHTVEAGDIGAFCRASYTWKVDIKCNDDVHRWMLLGYYIMT